MDLATTLFLLLVAGGYLLPVPSIVMAAYSHFRPAKAVTTTRRRSTLIRFALCASAATTLFWGYAVFEQLHNAYSYSLPSAQFGRWLSLGVAILALATPGKVRVYLILFAFGLFLFFGCSIGELP